MGVQGVARYEGGVVIILLVVERLSMREKGIILTIGPCYFRYTTCCGEKTWKGSLFSREEGLGKAERGIWRSIVMGLSRAERVVAFG